MGAPYEFNYILRLRPEQGLVEAELRPGARFAFAKEGHRIYPVDVPIELADGDWRIVGRVAVRSFTVGGGRTSGEAEVLLAYAPEEVELLTRLNAQGEARNRDARA